MIVAPQSLARALSFVLGIALLGGLMLPADGRAMSPAEATPAQIFPLPGNQPGWQEWGSGEMTFIGFRLYRATLWVAGPAMESAPHALLLQYRRDISRQQLVSASIDEMRRTGTDSTIAEKWRADLERVFPDVKEGDRIIGLHLPGQGVRFFHQGKSTGDVNDAEFARRFFAIWLDPRTRSPAVREQLLKRPGTSGG